MLADLQLQPKLLTQLSQILPLVLSSVIKQLIVLIHVQQLVKALALTAKMVNVLKQNALIASVIKAVVKTANVLIVNVIKAVAKTVKSAKVIAKKANVKTEKLAKITAKNNSE